MRCDLHIHSTASGMCSTPGLSRVCRESYNEPEQTYQRLKHRGMSIVTITDPQGNAVTLIPIHADYHNKGERLNHRHD